MPCPHFSVSIVKRSQSKSAVAGAAYQSGTNLFSEYDQTWRRYSYKQNEVLHQEILLPDHAPQVYRDRATLWNAAEAKETQPDSQLARRIIMALPIEIPTEQYPDLVRDFCQKYLVSEGMCVDFAIHDPNKTSRNPHAHILLTLRSIDADGNWMSKCHKAYDLDDQGHRIRLPSGEWKSHRVNVNDWNNPANCEMWRHGWEQIQNEYLERNHRPERVDLRSYERQGNTQIPTVHMGRAACAMEARGEHSWLGDLNRDIRKTNQLLAAVQQGIKKLKRWLEQRIESVLEQQAQKEIERHPPIVDHLYSWVLIRSNERKNWSNRAVSVKRMASDFKKAEEAITYLKANRLFTLEDMQARLNDLESETKEIRGALRVADTRLKNIAGIMDASQTVRRLQNVHDQYARTFFKKVKEKYQIEHRDELAQYDKAYRFLMKVNGGNAVNAPALRAEQKKLTEKRRQMQERLESIKPDLDQLRNISRCIDRAIEDQEPEHLHPKAQLAYAAKQLEMERQRSQQKMIQPPRPHYEHGGTSR